MSVCHGWAPQRSLHHHVRGSAETTCGVQGAGCSVGRARLCGPARAAHSGSRMRLPADSVPRPCNQQAGAHGREAAVLPGASESPRGAPGRGKAGPWPCYHAARRRDVLIVSKSL